MPMNQRSKILIGAAALLVLVAILVVIIVTTHKAGGVTQKCPAEVKKCEALNHLYHVESGKCLLKGETPEGVCSRNMAILPVVTCRIQGQCECNYDSHERLLIYDHKTEQCYFIYEQGICPDGQVVVLAANRSGLACEADVCLAEKAQVPYDQRDNIVPFNKKCYRLFSKLDVPGCKGELKFWKNKAKPSCNRPDSYNTGGIGAIPSAECPPGSFQAVNGHCQPPIEFDFD